mmetsp:Transcript_5359/g.8976  ORF Transcript_5359/g.8976 Transcript_5359/m.8976 type:complete len:147 (+) Transcript_5359:1075-1515(+)
MAPAGLAELLKWNAGRERQRACLANRSNALEDAMTSSRTPSEFHAMINALFLTAIETIETTKFMFLCSCLESLSRSLYSDRGSRFCMTRGDVEKFDPCHANNDGSASAAASAIGHDLHHFLYIISLRISTVAFNLSLMTSLPSGYC